jgi:LCP family protein required for cell wall assembly
VTPEEKNEATPFSSLQKNPPRPQDISLHDESAALAPQHPQSLPAIPRSTPRPTSSSASARQLSLHGEMKAPPLQPQKERGISTITATSFPAVSRHSGSSSSAAIESKQAVREQLTRVPTITITSFPAVARPAVSPSAVVESKQAVREQSEQEIREQLEGLPTITSFPAQPRPGGPPPAVIRGRDGYLNGNRPTAEGKNKLKQLPMWARVLIAALVVLLVVLGGGFWYYQTNYAATLGNIVGHSAIHDVKGTPDLGNSNDVLTGGRMNILLLGSDSDTKFTQFGGAPLAQTDIIVTIDPQTNYVGMLSIPRDMQVQDPVTGDTHKLDEVFADGWSGNNFADRIASAAGRSIDTIQANFGITINHYAWVGLQGFAKVIDTAGGIDIDATHPMVDDLYPNDVNNTQGSAYDYMRLYIAPGPQHMNGTEALDYVRTRHSDQAGDFGRSARQQQVLSQLKVKLATPNIISQIPQLTQDLNGSVETDLTLSQLVQLGNYARGIDTNKVDKVTFSPPFYSTAIEGNTNLAPICDKVQAEIQKMFGTAGNCVPQVSNGAVQQGLATTVPHTNQAVAQTVPHTSQAVAQQNVISMSAADINPITDIRDVLDIVFLVTFESPDAAKV